jgi:hypothetical protein
MKSKASILATSLLRNRSPPSILKVEFQGLHHGVVVRVATPVHAADDTALGKDLLVVLTRVGGTLVRVSSPRPGQRRLIAISSAAMVGGGRPRALYLLLR